MRGYTRAAVWSLAPLLAAVTFATAVDHAPDPAGDTPEARSWRGDAAQRQTRVRRASGAGTWYPADATELREMVDGYLSGSPAAGAGKPVALIAPHAGYEYSGSVAGKGYGTLKGHSYERVIVFGLSHRVPLRGASVLRVDAYETPLGRIPVDTVARNRLLQSPAVTEMPTAHQTEHSVENQLPMLQRALGDFALVEVLVGEMSTQQRTSLAGAIRALMNDVTLLVVSTDFTHYGPQFGYTPFRDRVPERLSTLNDLATQEILQVDVPGWEAFLEETQATICGRNAVALLLAVLEPREDIEGRRVAFDTSGRMTGDWTNSVSYASIVFRKSGDGLTESEQRTLLRIARSTVTEQLERGALPNLVTSDYDLTPRLRAPGAAFVTLRNGSEMRGCIGHIAAVRPLYLSVVENALWAVQDPRFRANPVTRAELPLLSIEVSILTPMRRLADPERVRVGEDGLLLIRGEQQGVLLPQVPIEQRWDKHQFLAGTCEKAGVPLDAWKDPQTELYRFTAQVFSEAELGVGPRAERSR